MRVLLLESFYGGSHRDVADNLKSRSRHEVTLETMPARFWKWRTRGAALEFVRRVPDPASYDLVVCTGLMNIAELRALWPVPAPPILLYAHETQLSYPVPDGGRVDAHYGMTDVVNMSVADAVVFNSESHRQRFLDELPRFLRRLPDYRPMWLVDRIERKSSVCYPGISVVVSDRRRDAERPPIVVWNHRWEFDKNPEQFFDAVGVLQDDGIDFRLAVLGENFQIKPQTFLDARKKFDGRIVAWGYEPDRDAYLSWLQRSTVVVSTALQENFGIAVLEAIAAGCHPVLPRRLSYPEIIPPRFHDDCLYDDEKGLVDLIRQRLTEAIHPANAGELSRHASTFAWDRRIADFDRLFEEVVSQ